MKKLGALTTARAKRVLNKLKMIYLKVRDIEAKLIITRN